MKCLVSRLIAPIAAIMSLSSPTVAQDHSLTQTIPDLSKTEVKVKTGKELTSIGVDYKLLLPPQTTSQHYIKDVVSFEASAPVFKNDKGTANLITETGLFRGISGTLKLRRHQVRNINNPSSIAQRRSIEIAAMDACEAMNSDDGAAQQQCLNKDISEVIADLAAANYQDWTTRQAQWKKLSSPDLSIFLYGASGSVGFNNFDFVDPTTFAERESDKTDYALSAFFGVRPNAKSEFYAAGLQYKVEHKDAKETVACSDLTNVPASCQRAEFSGPVKNKDASIFGLVRKNFGTEFFGLPLAAELKLAYDFEDDAAGVSIPIYYVPELKNGDLTGGLNGGVRVSWQDDEDDDITVGLFFSTAFNLFGDP